MSEEIKKRGGGNPWSEERRKKYNETIARKRKEPKTSGKRMGRPPWTDEQRQSYRETIARRRREAEARGEKVLENAASFHHPQLAKKPEDLAIVRSLMAETLHSWHCPMVKSDAELEERIEQFFQTCAEHGTIPTIEEMYLATGYSYSYMYDIEHGIRNGFSPETKKIIERARQLMKTFDAKMVVEGKINPVVYFFRSKNYYDMKDQQDVVVQGPRDNVQEMSEEDIRKWYLEDGKKVETTFTDDES